MSEPNNHVNVRELALSALLAMERQEEYSHVVIGGILDKYNYLDARQKAFFKRLTEGTLERRIQLDYCIDHFSKVPVQKMKPLIRELLRMGAYQLLFMDGVPDAAVCNEAVKLAQSHSFGSLKGFVNGVLRSMARGREQITYPDRQRERLAHLSVRYSMPMWLVERWEAERGVEVTEKILQDFLEEKPVTLRLKGGLPEGERQALLEELKERGAKVRQSPYLPDAWLAWGMESPASLPAFWAGNCTVQDVSSMLAVEGAGIKPGDFVMDVCAAPGGKTFFAAEQAGSAGQVLAGDVSLRRLASLEENRRRLMADTVTFRQWDAAVPDEASVGRADVVLADVPCSGLGVIGKKPDIKYRVTESSIGQLAALQRRILGTVWRYVKPGGVLLYSTCTILRTENEGMVEWFVENFPFHLESLLPFLPGQLSTETAKEGYVQLLPGVHGTDGFFFARLVRDDDNGNGDRRA